MLFPVIPGAVAASNQPPQAPPISTCSNLGTQFRNIPTVILHIPPALIRTGRSSITSESIIIRNIAAGGASITYWSNCYTHLSTVIAGPQREGFFRARKEVPSDELGKVSDNSKSAKYAPATTVLDKGDLSASARAGLLYGYLYHEFDPKISTG